jgi:hypothetical protein
MHIPYSEYPRLDLLIIIISQFIFILIVGGLIYSLSKKFKQNHADVVKSLLIFFILLEISTISAWLPKFLNYFEIYIDLIYGVPIGGGNRIWWTNFSYIFNTATTIWLMLFTQQLFKFENRKILIFQILLVIGFNIWSVYHGIFVYTPGSSSLTMQMSILLIVIMVLPTFYLFKFSRRDIKRLPPSVFRFGFQLIFLSTTLSIIAYLYWILSIILPFPEWASIISWILNSLVMILMSLGLTLPEWLRNYVKNRYNLKEEE